MLVAINVVRILTLAFWFNPIHAATNLRIEEGKSTGIYKYDFDFTRTAVPKKVVDAWRETDGGCETEYFRISNETFTQSRALEWYTKVVLPHWAEHGNSSGVITESTYFGEVFLGVDNFSCDVKAGTCGGPNPPRCKDIVGHIKGENSSMPIELVLEEARRRHFISLHMDQLAKMAKKTADMFVAVQVGITDDTGAVAKAFFPQKNPSADDRCHWAKFGLNFALTVVATAASMGMGAGLAAQVAKEVSGTVEMAIKQSLRSSGSDGGLGLIFNLIKSSYEHKNSGSAFNRDGTPNIYNSMTARLLDGDIGDLTVSHTEGGLCGSLGSNRQDENFDHLATLNFWIGNHFTGLRDMVWTAIDDALHNTNPNHSVLPKLFAGMNWSKELVEEYKKIDSEFLLKQEFRERMVSYAWQAGHCYLKCEDFPLSEEIRSREGGRDKICGGEKSKLDYKYCRPDDPVTCQIQCWTSQSESNREVQLFGKEQLGKFNLTLQGMMDKALQKWPRGSIFSKNAPDLSQKSMSDSAASFGIAALELGSNVDIAVCNTNRGALLQHFDGGRNANLDKNSVFPCSCGEWGNMQTRMFMDKIKMGVNSVGFRSGAIKETMEWTCPHILDKLSFLGTLTPVENYLEYCQLGIQFPPSRNKKEPLHDWHRVKMYRGPHKHCKTIEEETKSMTLEDANRHFCSGWSQASRDVMNQEADYSEGAAIVTPVSLTNHWDLCKRVYKKYIAKGKWGVPPPDYNIIISNNSTIVNETQTSNVTEPRNSTLEIDTEAEALYNSTESG